LVGPRLTAHIGYLKGACHASYTTIQKYMSDVLGVPFSTGQLAKVVGKVTSALDPAYAELLEALPSAASLNVDETGHKDNGDRYWTWCFRAHLYTLFRIDPSRGSQVLLDTLGKEFAGVIGADYFSAYRKYMGDCGVLIQFCLAHLIRDVKYLTTLSDKATKKYGDHMLARLRTLFHVIHRRERMSEAGFQGALEKARKRLVFTATHPPCTCAADNLAERFRKHGDAYFQFITTPGIEPTNNLAEQAIRFVVIDRRITQGTRGEAGRRWSERIWTTIATCAQQGRSVCHFLQQAVQAHFTGKPSPSLLFNTS
jgi:transposase